MFWVPFSCLLFGQLVQSLCQEDSTGRKGNIEHSLTLASARSLQIRFDPKHASEWEAYVRSLESRFDLATLDAGGPIVWTPEGRVMSGLGVRGNRRKRASGS